MNENEPHPDGQRDEALAIMLAGIAERIALQRLGQRGPGWGVDRAIEATLSRILAEWRPQDGIRGPELGVTGADRRRRWLLCPLDGRDSHRAGERDWGITVGLEQDGQLTTAVMVAPLRDETWAVTRGGGVRRNGSRLTVPESGDLIVSERAAELGRSGALTPEVAETLEHAEVAPVAEFWPETLVAGGAIDVDVETDDDSWSAGARRLLLEEAGGGVVDLSVPGAAGPRLACSRPEVRRRLLVVPDIHVEPVEEGPVVSLAPAPNPA